MGIQTLSSVMPVQCSTGGARRPTVTWSLCWLMISLHMMDIDLSLYDVNT